MTYQTSQGSHSAIHVAAVALLALSLVWICSALAVTSNVNVGLGPGLFLFLFSAMLTMATIVLGVCAIRVRRRVHNRWLIWCGVVAGPVFIAIMIVAATYDLPFRLRFAIGRGELEAYAEAVLLQPEDAAVASAERVGTFRVLSARRLGQCVYFRTGSAFVYDVGLVYCQKGSLPSQVMAREQVSGQWWRWEKDILDGGFR